MPRNLDLWEYRDMTGGLNFRSDQFQLANNESPDLLNVDVDPRGGVKVRRAQVLDASFTPRTGALALNFLAPFPTHGNVVGFNSGNTVVFSGGAAVSSTGASGVVDAAQMHDPTAANPMRLFLVRGSGTVWSVGGATGTTLTDHGAFAFSNDLAAPTSGGVMSGYTCATHLSRLFVGRTFESATEKPNRLRWSHPGRPRDFRQVDFIDVGDAGEEITALIPFGDHLVIFTDRSIHALFGDAPERWSIHTISRVVGASNPQAVAATPGRLYWWSTAEGVFSYDGVRINYLFDKLRPALLTGRMQSTPRGQLGYADGLLYVPIELDSQPRTLVFDPTLGARGTGAWVLYDLPMQGVVSHAAVDGTTGLIYSRQDDVTNTRLYTLSETIYSDQEQGSTPTPIRSHFHTRWFDVGLPAALKRWRRPRVVITSTSPQSVNMDIYHDYNSAQLKKRLLVDTLSDENESYWDIADWDIGEWMGDGQMYDFDRPSRLGRSNAVQLRFHASATTRWGIDSVTLVYETKPLR